MVALLAKLREQLGPENEIAIAILVRQICLDVRSKFHPDRAGPRSRAIRQQFLRISLLHGPQFPVHPSSFSADTSRAGKGWLAPVAMARYAYGSPRPTPEALPCP